jgi:hypothetical protein
MQPGQPADLLSPVVRTRFFRTSLHCARASALSAFLPQFAGSIFAGSIMVPSDRAANTCTPRSMPTTGRLGITGQAAIPYLPDLIRQRCQPV